MGTILDLWGQRENGKVGIYPKHKVCEGKVFFNVGINNFAWNVSLRISFYILNMDFLTQIDFPGGIFSKLQIDWYPHPLDQWQMKV